MGHYHALLATPKTVSKKLTLTVVEMQQLPDIEKKDSGVEFFCPKLTLFTGGRKVCVNFRTDTDKLCAVTEIIHTSKIMKLI